MREYLKKKEDARNRREKEERKKAREEKKKLQETKKKDSEKKLRQKNVSESDSTGESEMSIADSDPEWHEDDPDEMDIDQISKKDLKEGSFVISELSGGKRNSTKYTYLCIVQEIEIESDLIKVMGLKSVDQNKKEFVSNEKDISYISFDQILGIVTTPQLTVRGERLRYMFAKPVNVREK